jgi:hypothetical protein
VSVLAELEAQHLQQRKAVTVVLLSNIRSVVLLHTTHSITPASIKHGLCQVASQVQLFICSELAAVACHSVQHMGQVAAVDTRAVRTP